MTTTNLKRALIAERAARTVAGYRWDSDLTAGLRHAEFLLAELRHAATCLDDPEVDRLDVIDRLLAAITDPEAPKFTVQQAPDGRHWEVIETGTLRLHGCGYAKRAEAQARADFLAKATQP